VKIVDYAIVVENLVKKFGDLVAVKGISFKVKKGEIFGFLGPNGAGKTTTIHILATLLRPTSGIAFVDGKDVVKEPLAVRKVIGIVFQDPSVDDQLTAYENLYIHGRIYGLRSKELEERINEALKFVELYKFKDKEVKTFSGGMRRRLEIARALLHEPKVLFLDEPTLGLDPQTRAKIWDYIRLIRKEKGVTIFLTTHYMDEAEELADRIAIIDKGKIIAEGTPDELKSLAGSEVVYVKFYKSPLCINEDFVDECKILGPETVMLKVKRASDAIPKIFEISRERGYKIKEIEYRRPTLNDAFLYLTGREIREEEGSEMERLRAIVIRRWRR
jgi:ABC-2 type transport system ATP-binding protein